MTKLNLQRIKPDQYSDGSEVYDVLKQKYKHNDEEQEKFYIERNERKKKPDYSENRKVKRGDL